MGLYFKMAFRNLVRHGRRTVITMASISVGLVVLVFLNAVIKAHETSMINSVVETHLGHLQIHQKDFLAKQQVNLTFEDSWFDRLKEVAGDSKLTPRVMLPMLFSTSENSSPSILIGVRPDTESKLTTIASNITSGAYLSDAADPNCDTRPVVIGKDLSEKLKAEVGDKVVVVGQGADGSIANELLRVVGIFNTGSPIFNKNYAFSTIDCVRKIGAIQGLHEIIVQAKDEKQIPETRARFEKVLSGSSVKVSEWSESVPDVAGMLRFNAAMFKLVSFILFFVITLGLVNIVMMNVFERTKEFGVMLALGTRPDEVWSIIILECFLLGVGSSILAAILGWSLIGYYSHTGFDLSAFIGMGTSGTGFKFKTVVYPQIDLLTFLRLSSTEILFVVVSGFFPAYKASQLNPIKVLRGM
jgi:putative ABC transport system permease protein